MTGLAPKASLRIPWDRVADSAGSNNLQIWLPDGASFVGQDPVRGQ